MASTGLPSLKVPLITTTPPNKSGFHSSVNAESAASTDSTFCSTLSILYTSGPRRRATQPVVAAIFSLGLMRCTGQPFGYVRTDKSFCDYKLTVEWRFIKIAPRADNSGVFVQVRPPDKVWPHCIENQGQYHHQGDLIFMGGAMFTGTNGPKAGMIKMQGQPNEKAAGEWNRYEIVCRGNTVKSYVNGRLMNEAGGCNTPSGAIAMQSEGGEWELRKIYIEPLP